MKPVCPCKGHQPFDVSTIVSVSGAPCSCRTGSLEAVPLCITQQQRDPASSGRLNTDLGFLLTAVNTPVEHILALVKVGNCRSQQQMLSKPVFPIPCSLFLPPDRQLAFAARLCSTVQIVRASSCQYVYVLQHASMSCHAVNLVCCGQRAEWRHVSTRIFWCHLTVDQE